MKLEEFKSNIIIVKIYQSKPIFFENYNNLSII